MDTMVSIWWVWLSAAIALAVLEVLAPGFIFIGFAIGALIMTAVVALFPTAMMPPPHWPCLRGVAGGMDRAKARVQKPKHRRQARDPGHQ